MSENKMAEVAQLLGVELDEEFIAKYPKGGKVRCRFYKNRFYTSDTGELWNINSAAFLDLLSGECTIHKLPWKAKLNETYYIPNPMRCIKYESCLHKDQEIANDWYLKGLMCKTKEQAIKTAEAMIKVAREMQGFKDNKEDK